MLLQALGIVFALFVARLIYRGHFHPLAKCPGPFLAHYTNLWRFFTYMRKQGHLVDEQLHAKYGHIVRTGPDSLSFSSISAYHVMYTVDRVFEKGSFYDFARDPYSNRSSIFTARTAADLRMHRRWVLNGAFSAPNIADLKSIQTKNAEALVRSIENERQKQPAGIINISPLIQVFATKLNFEMIHGLTLDDFSPESQLSAVQDLQKVSKFSFGFSYLPLLGYLVSSRLGRKILRKPKLDPVTGEPVGMSALFARSIDAVWNRDEEIGAQDAQPSFLKAWLAVEKDNENKRMDKMQLERESLNLVFAGRGSTAMALTVILHILGSQKGRVWQERVREELSGDWTPLTAGRDNLPPLLAAVVRETLRLYPAFPRGFPREIGPGAVVVMPEMDKPLPSGTEVYSSSYVIARQHEVWGPHATEWKPERWLQVNERVAREGDDSVADLSSLESRFLAFGKGSRGCIGRDVAMQTILEVVSGVLQRWDVKSENELVGSVDWEVRYDDCQLRLVERPVAS